MSSRRYVMLALLFTFSIVLAVPAWAQFQDTQGTGQSIYGCTVISRPGSYVLAKNITATQRDLKRVAADREPGCIVIVADFVSLDLRGHTIAGPGTALDSGMGIYSTANAELKYPIAGHIKNGSVNNFQRGIAIEGDGHTVEGVRVARNNVGLSFDGDANKVKDVVAMSNYWGILSWSGYGNSVENCQVHQNLGSGIALGPNSPIPGVVGSLGSRIVGNTVSSNATVEGYGIYAPCPSLILQNMAFDNGAVNIFVTGSDCIRSNNNPEP